LASATTAHPILVRHSHCRRLAETTSPRLSDATAFPRFNAKLEFITSSAGTTHPVVWVPSHGAVPVCSKADGPQDERGRPQGININTYHIRTPRPQSEPIHHARTVGTLNSSMCHSGAHKSSKRDRFHCTGAVAAQSNRDSQTLARASSLIERRKAAKC